MIERGPILKPNTTQIGYALSHTIEKKHTKRNFYAKIEHLNHDKKIKLKQKEGTRRELAIFQIKGQNQKDIDIILGFTRSSQGLTMLVKLETSHLCK